MAKHDLMVWLSTTHQPPLTVAALQEPAVVAHCVAEANVYALASHQFWGTWALLQVVWLIASSPNKLVQRIGAAACAGQVEQH